MTKKFLSAVIGAGFGLAVSAVFAASALIEDAKRQCVIGERTDGYLGVVEGARASDELRREMTAVNQQRKAAYARLAAKNGVTISDTGRVAAERLINRAPSGQCVQNAGGGWVRVP